MTRVTEIGGTLRGLATHHNHGEGWRYTRDLGGLKHIRYARDFEGYNSVPQRIKRAFDVRHLTGTDSISRQFGWKWNLIGAWAWIVVSLRTDRNTPDGSLNGGCVLTFWEEDGEYIETVGPTVGQKIADFLEAEPTNPHAIAIAREIERIWALGDATGRGVSTDA